MRLFGVLLLLSVASFGQLVIKGHYVGESTEEFISKDSAIQDKLAACHNNIDRRECEPLVNVFYNHSSGTITSGSGIAANWVFDAGKVTGFSMFASETYSEVVADLTKRIGHGPEEIAVPYRNGFGASWVTHEATWETKDVFVSVLENNNPAESMRLPYVNIEPIAEHKAEMKALADRKNSLD